MNDRLEAVRDYQRRGISLVPFRAIAPAPGEKKWKKRPFVDWKERQKNIPDEKIVISEFEKIYPDALIGGVTGVVSKICTLDIDNDEGRKIADELVPDSLLVPTFQTMSGGMQMMFQNPDPSIPGMVRFRPGLDYRGEGSCAILPDGNRYRWFDGLSIREVELPPMPGALLSALINKESTLYRGGDDKYDDNGEMFADGRRDNDLFRTANFLVKGGMPAGEIFQVLKKLIISWGEKPDAKWIDAKIKSAIDRANQREGSLAQDIREWVLSSSGVFLSSDVAKELGLSSRVVMQNTSKVLTRLCEGESPLIERYGNKRGCYRRLDNEIEPLDWQTADVNPLNLIWPFGIHNLVNLYPGNVAIIAGYPNAGKTAFIHNFIRLNQQQHEIHLFSSEGGKEELKMRLSKFDCPLSEWNFKAWERSGDFADVIKPDAINIIDYLEIHDDFYKVGGMIKAISDKLKNGFALIAIQKNTGRDEGLGGARGLEKPRLYLAMDSGRLKIVKAKSWVDSANNPNGQAVKFKIVDGCKFVIQSRWERND